MNAKDERFRAIYTKYVQLLRIIARKRNIPEADIEDLVQETFTAYYSHYPLDWSECQIKAVLTKIMRNRCVDYFRKQDKWLLTYCDPVEIQERMFSEEERFGRDSLSAYLEHQELENVLNALSSMKDDWARVFVLYVIEGRPMSEVSEIMDLSADACRARLPRGRKYLRQYLCPEEPEKYRPSVKHKASPEGA